MATTKTHHYDAAPTGYVVREGYGRIHQDPKRNDREGQSSGAAVVESATRSKAAAQAFLRERGMINQFGKLTRAYGGN